MKNSLRIVLGRVSVGVVALFAGFGMWWYSLDLASQLPADPGTTPAELDFLVDNAVARRGKVLAVVTSTEKAGEGINAGYELTELARAYYIFRANGYDVQIASPQGGRAPVNIDEELTETDYAFLNDPQAQRLVGQTQRLADVEPDDFDAVYFVGGKGAMFDLANNAAVQELAARIYDHGGVVGAVCHGPAALLGARLADGTRLLEGKTVAGFTNEEELFIIPDARMVFPFLLQDGLMREAMRYTKAPKYLDHTVVDGRLVTGQNPWSTWSVAEGMVRAMGHFPVARERTREERAVDVLGTYHSHGLEDALQLKASLPDADKRSILLHSLIALMDGQPFEAFQLQRLAH